MKTRKELIEELTESRNEVINNINDEFVRFEESVDTDKLYEIIEESIKEQYPRFGKFKVKVKLQDFIPQNFEYKYTSEHECDYYVRDDVVTELAQNGYSITTEGLNLTIT